MRKYYNPNLGKSPDDPTYDHSFDEEEEIDLYNEACVDRSEAREDED